MFPFSDTHGTLFSVLGGCLLLLLDLNDCRKKEPCTFEFHDTSQFLENSGLSNGRAIYNDGALVMRDTVEFFLRRSTSSVLPGRCGCIYLLRPVHGGHVSC